MVGQSFLRVTAIPYVCSFVGATIGALLLQQDAWIPINIALGIHGICRSYFFLFVSFSLFLGFFFLPLGFSFPLLDH